MPHSITRLSSRVPQHRDLGGWRRVYVPFVPFVYTLCWNSPCTAANTDLAHHRDLKELLPDKIQCFNPVAAACSSAVSGRQPKKDNVSPCAGCC
jgi:hypothetical protein